MVNNNEYFKNIKKNEKPSRKKEEERIISTFLVVSLSKVYFLVY